MRGGGKTQGHVEGWNVIPRGSYWDALGLQPTPSPPWWQMGKAWGANGGATHATQLHSYGGENWEGGSGKRCCRGQGWWGQGSSPGPSGPVLLPWGWGGRVVVVARALRWSATRRPLSP